MSLSVIETRAKVELMEQYLAPILVRDLIQLFKQCFRALKPGQEYAYQLGEYVDSEHREILDVDNDPFMIRLEGAICSDDSHPIPDKPTEHWSTVYLVDKSRELWVQTTKGITSVRSDSLYMRYDKKLSKGIYRLDVKLAGFIRSRGTIIGILIDIIDAQMLTSELPAYYNSDTFRAMREALCLYIYALELFWCHRP